MSECICVRKTNHLHVADCPVVQKRVKTGLFVLAEEAFNKPNSFFVYVSPTIEASVAERNRFRHSLKDNEWMYFIEANNIGTITLFNGAEISFCAEEDALLLLGLPNQGSFFFEKTNATRDLVDALSSNIKESFIVNPETKEIIS